MSATVLVPLSAAPPRPIGGKATAAPLRPSCPICWGQGKVWELARGVIQAVPVPCDECFGTGRAWGP